MGNEKLELWAGIECTVNRIGDVHFDQLARSGHDKRFSDLELFADVGARRVRYPVLWERTNDWRWPTERLSRLRALGIEPIVGLLHHGSGPRGTSLLAENFAIGLADFARRVAERFPWVLDWTPVNEPLTTARFSALYGHWYPHARDDRLFVRALLNQLRGTVLAMRAIRTVIPEARLIQTEDIGKTWSTPKLDYQADFENERRWLTYDLLCGSLRPDGLVASWLRELGISEQEVDWFRSNPCPPDVIGVNHYLSGERFLDDRLDCYPPATHGTNGRLNYADVLAARVLEEGLAGPVGVLRAAWRRYGRPLAVTEAHNGCTREEQLRWLRDVWAAAEDVRREGADVRAVTVWSMLGAFGWADLLTQGLGAYEPGVFDLRAPRPRRTALASLAKALGEGASFPHPALDGPGWWRRRERLLYPPIGPLPAPFQQQGRKLVVTGATGTLGYAFSRICAERGLAHHATAREKLDVADRSSVDAALALLRPWAVVNTAGYVRVDEAEGDTAACFAANRDGAANLARACAELGIPLVTFSTDLVFGGASRRPYVETDEPSPLSVYGQSKLEAESLVLTDHPSSLVVRTGSFFGPWDEHNFLARAVAALADGEIFEAAADVVVSPTYVPDLVNATLDLLIDGETGLWHLANEGAVTWAELARRVAAVRKLPVELVHGVPATSLPWTARRPSYSALASERAWVMPTLDDALVRYDASLSRPEPKPRRHIMIGEDRS
jgi:dTDP-4-dehydrorhamnose reductase